MKKPKKSAAKLHEYVPPDWYESSVKTNLFQRYWHYRRFRAVKKFSPTVTGRILDIGSADGFFTAEILRQTDAASIEGIDVLKSSVDYARRRYRGNTRLRFQVADAHHLPFPKNHFSAVYCLEAMEHVLDPKKVLAEIYRVLAPGGYIILLVPAENWLFKLGWPFWLRWRGKIWKDTHLNFFDNSKLPNLVSSAGFKNIYSYRFILGMLLLVKAAKPKRVE